MDKFKVGDVIVRKKEIDGEHMPHTIQKVLDDRYIIGEVEGIPIIIEKWGENQFELWTVTESYWKRAWMVLRGVFAIKCT